MKTFILSCDDERFERLIDRLPTLVGEPERINVTPENMGQLPEWFDGAPNRWALTVAHATALEKAMEADEDCLALEDDAIFREDFEKWFPRLLAALPDDWNQLFLGGQLGLDKMPPKYIPSTPLLLEASCVHRSHAILTNRNSLKRVRDWWISEKPWGSKHTCDWRHLYLHRQKDFHVYVPSMGWLIGQGGGKSVLDPVNYPDRWWDFTMPEIYLHAPTDQIM